MDVHREHRARTAGRFHVTANPSPSNASQNGNRSLTPSHLQIYTCVFTNVTRNKHTHFGGLRDNVTVVPDVPAALPFKSSCGTPLKCHSRFETKSQKQRCFKSPPPKKNVWCSLWESGITVTCDLWFMNSADKFMDFCFYVFHYQQMWITRRSWPVEISHIVFLQSFMHQHLSQQELL